MLFTKSYDYNVIIVGGGHAAIEASYILSKKKCRTLLITFNKNKIGELSCNPSIGGLGKSNLVKEIDSLSGLMGKLVDLSGINYKILNSSKGYAVRATRVQIDKELYKKNVIYYLNKNKKYLHIIEDEVIDLVIYNNIVCGVKTLKYIITSYIVILCVGTFLDSKIFIGNDIIYAGRLNDNGSYKLAFNLKKYYPYFGYLKTGTPPRLNKYTVNFSNLEKQVSEIKLISKFSFFNSLRKNKFIKQHNCYLTYTNLNTHKIVIKNLYKSPLFNGLINSKGPRYCPSLEYKIYNFLDKNRHNIYLEPESIYNNYIYPNGLSMSFPLNIQYKIIKSIMGLGFSKIIIPGYSVEYMYLNPIFLNKTLESKVINNLFIAGQINGTTGYEEAAAQGLIAGINSYLKISNKKLFIPKRLNSYIGVLIDDLCTKGIKEPYRIFNSRSEFSLYLREDNADYRLTPIAKKLGLINNKKWIFFKNKMNQIYKISKFIINKIYNINDLKTKWQKLYKNKKTIQAKSLICNSCIKFNKIKKFIFKDKKKFLSNKFLKEIKILFIYKGYIKRQKLELFKYKLYEKILLPNKIKYENIKGLSNEVIQILNYIKPNFLGQLLRISGITPISLMIIYIYLKKHKLINIVD